MSSKTRNAIMIAGLINLLAAGAATRAAMAADANDAAGETDGSALQEVVVTAERREESEQKTPIVMTVLSNQDLENVGATDVVRAAELMPGVHVLPDPLSGAQIAIRGVVNNNVNVGSDPSLAMSVDDIYIARSQAAFASFYDIQRVEVLKGPQGTLYGRNSISGAMNIITNDPKHEWGANGELEVGNYGASTIEGMVNVPLGDRIAVRVAGESVKHDGYIDHYWDNEDNKAGRIKLLAELSDTASVILSASEFKEGGVGDINPVYPFVSANPWNPGNPTARGQSSVNDEVYNFSAKLRWDTAIGDLTYVRGYTRFDEDYIAPPNGIFLARWGQSNQDTDEVRLASHTQADAAGKLQWIGGVFWYRETQNQSRHVAGNVALGGGPLLPLSQLAAYPYVFAGSLAEFGQVTYAIQDHLRVTGGLRATRDTKSAYGYNNFSLGTLVTNTTETPNESENNISYKAEIETDLGPTSLLYASLTTGFHGGGWQDASPPYGTYKPETITDYEIGIKNEFLNHRLRVNLGAYYYDYKNFLVSASNSLPQNATCACFVNAPKARADGLELETEFAATADDRLAVSLAYEDTDYSDFTIYQPWSNNNIPGGTPIAATASSPAGQDFSGTPFPYVSKWSGTASYSHIFHLGGAGDINAQVETQYRSAYPGALGNDPSLRQSSYSKTDVSLGYEPNRHWSVTLWARNLERATAAASAGTARPGPVTALNPITLSIGEPRTYGVRLNAQL